ncbi:hypothetical protein SPI_00277 [Niveomyces insectorum RCEF 264]|uniref:Tetratricopeptide-like helical n=1 Tax=Niveomyces insectorum RCEF 264 TaxID=1081102 RepID=A0A162JFC4_9HYPO|nr:hypothetical protein SPI_00277 [Niveomyces insectorum RCEF 264]
MVVSVQPFIDGGEVDILRHPQHCAEARNAVNRLLDEIEIVQNLWDAARAPRPPRSRAQFIRYVFERERGFKGTFNAPQDRQRARKAALQRMDSLSVALCAAAYTEASIQNMSDALFRALLACSGRIGFAGDPDDGAHRGLSVTWMEFLPDGFLKSILSVSVIAENTCHDRFIQDLAEVLLDAGKNVPASDRLCLLDTATRALDGHGVVRLRARLAHQKSVALRLTGDLPGSDREISAFLRHEGSQNGLDGLSYNQLGWLHLSSANNHLFQSKFSHAHEEAKKLKLAASVSGLTRLSGSQFELLWDQIYCVGRIMRGEGRFDDAKLCFESCLQTPTDISRSKLTVVKSALGDVYCELDYDCRSNADSAAPHFYLNRARELVGPDVEARRGPVTKGMRRLLLSVSEIEIREGRHSHANTLLLELLTTYAALREPDIVDRLGHVRTRIALARITSQFEAETHWQEALRLNAFYNPAEEEVYTCGVIYLHLSHIRHVRGDFFSAASMFNHGMNIISKKRPNHLIPGIGTYIFDEICQKWGTTHLIPHG